MLKIPSRTAREYRACTRISHPAWKAGASGTWRTFPKPCLPPRSCMPSIASSRLKSRDTNERIARYGAGQGFFGPALGACRPLGQYHVARIGSGIPHSDLYFWRQIQAHFLQYRARLPDDPRSIFQVLIPIRRQPDNRHGGTRTQGAANHILHSRRVLEHDEMAMMLWHRQAQLGNGGTPVCQETFAESIVHPRLGDNAGAVFRDPPLRRGVWKLIDSFRGFHPSLVECRLYGIHPLLHRGGSFDGAIFKSHVRHPQTDNST